MLIHTRQKPHMCQVCQQSFNQKSHLKFHMHLHTWERPFKCQQCEKCFNHVSLKNHVQRHHGPGSEVQGEREKELESQVPNSGTEQVREGAGEE
ncbi:unnamed protein product [Coregonus sp. 'balchen']|nr:unnamed protein product [Coregonus sp. 'balchen']